MIEVPIILNYKMFKFPAGEIHITLQNPDSWAKFSGLWINFHFHRSEEIIELLLLVNAINEAGGKVEKLTIPYFPFSRQDRVAVPGDTFSLRVMCELINSLNIPKVVVYDPHSHVLPALLRNIEIIKQEDILAPIINSLTFHPSRITVIAPDAGALKKASDVAKKAAVSDVVNCFKQRDPKTGEITGTVVQADHGYLDNKVCIIVDDICDGGRTFIEIAKAIRQNHKPMKIILMVTHGLFTKGLDVFDGLIDEIYTKDRRVATNRQQTRMERVGV